MGIYIGNVLPGGGVDEDGPIRSVAVNIAARMEQSAPAGALRISHDSCQPVRARFDVQPLPPMQVKGHDAPIHTCPSPVRSRALCQPPPRPPGRCMP